MKTQIFNAADLTDVQLARAAQDIAHGAVAVFPTDTVYGIGTYAFNEASISRIYTLKNRPAGSALQILTGTVEQAKAITQWGPQAQKLAQAFWPGALTVILPANAAGQPLLRGFAALGIRVPGNRFLVELMTQMGGALASTSANLHGQPTLTQEKDILQTFDGKADYIFLGGTLSPVASSVINLAQHPAHLIREGAVSRARLEQVLGEKID